MKSATRLTSKGQVVIPKPVRDLLRWKAGTRLRVEATKDGAVVLRPGGRPTIDELIEELSGCMREFGGDPISELEAEHRAEVKRDAQRTHRRR